MVSVDVKHHVYLLSLGRPSSLISLMVSVDVKHRVYLLKLPSELRSCVKVEAGLRGSGP